MNCVTKIVYLETKYYITDTQKTLKTKYPLYDYVDYNSHTKGTLCFKVYNQIQYRICIVSIDIENIDGKNSLYRILILNMI